ncbi:type VII secretion protein EssB [Candidatus Enterococcus murrayae]|uniref:Type VII secretion protein EssB n=1 Tax=Candidatus Enterococcus murrayae TaxID=2815321 RepID=A0ABS3HBY6_9ENTE|nr:type VII secretion protein EssB [Enterococcus sp. MJM16]MBO0450965.1 type VII secretion protein EssB [Enterococcus sp. MJM16]
MERNDGTTTIEQTLNQEALTTRLTANQFKGTMIAQYQSILEQTDDCLKGKITQHTEEELIINYEIPTLGETTAKLAERSSELERLELAQKMRFLLKQHQQLINPFVHPENVFVVGDTVRLAHRGLLEIIAPFQPTDEVFFKQYKALICFILQPKLDFSGLVDGLGAVKHALVEKIYLAATPEEIDQHLSESITILRERNRREKKLVKKQHYRLFKWGSIGLLVVAIGLGIGLSVYAGRVVPLQERVIEAESKFIFNDYSGAATELKQDEAEKLPTSAQYILAVSYIQLDSLTNEQKEAVLNTISQKSSENTLLFWIYLGRGNFEKALSLAKNIGDNQYVLHAYTKLYDATKANTRMDGEKKQELLKEYEEQINNYVKLLGGQANDDQAK